MQIRNGIFCHKLKKEKIAVQNKVKRSKWPPSQTKTPLGCKHEVITKRNKTRTCQRATPSNHARIRNIFEKENFFPRQRI